jgi:hypothetical protein
MQQSKAIIVGSVIIGACILAFLGYTIRRGRADADAAMHQQFIAEQQAEHVRRQSRLKEYHDLRLDAYEREFGHIERLRLEAFEDGVLAEGVGTTCKKLSLSPNRCEALKNNWQALFARDSKFARPSAQ